MPKTSVPVPSSVAGSSLRRRSRPPEGLARATGGDARTVLLAVPVLVAAAFVEVYVSPGLLRALAG